ncbi:MAG: HAMP domain-containing histidine kinase [Clostridia bacterium]|nr:HAMP domain-containing histidine kinase [Clostridia bacterium]
MAEHKGGGIKKRWILNNLIYVVLLVVLAVIIYSVASMNFSYSSTKDNLTSRSLMSARYFNDNVNTDFSSFYHNARRQTLDFTERDRLERQILYTDGRVMFSTSGLPTGTIPGTPEIDRAILENKVCDYIGTDPMTGERILSVTAPLVTDNQQVIGAIRYVTSLREVDKDIIVKSLIATLIGIIIILLVFVSNRYFVRSIVNPLNEIIEITKQITKGSYGIKIEKKYDDEIGELCDTINEMSLELSRTEKMKNEFISSVSHELRTPLTAIIGWGETLTAVGAENYEETQKGIGIILKETRRLSKMVEELLVFARMESGRFNLCMEEMDLKVELEETLFMYNETFKKKKIKIAYDQCDGDIIINGDRERLKQVFFNILDNAVKHGEKGEKLEIGAHISEEGNAVISIRDFGEGIPEEELPYVKLKFYKGTSKTQGSGIGLAVSDEIVKLHGGELKVESTFGEGTCVYVILPLIKVTMEEINPEEGEE